MSKYSEDGTIDLRGKNKSDAEFRIGEISENEAEPEDMKVVGKVHPVPESELDKIDQSLTGKVKLKFDKFVSLVASHAYEEIFEKYKEEDIIIGTDLLTDLANAHEEKSDKKMPVIFIGGLVIGGIIMWVLLRT